VAGLNEEQVNKKTEGNMMDDTTLRHPADDKFKRLATDFGFACSLLFECGQGRFTVASAYMWILPAVQHRQFHVLFASNGRPVGYVTWAFVSDDTLTRLRTDSVTVLDASEWNEGLNLWIVDVVCRKGQAIRLIASLRKRLRGNWMRASGLKRKPDGSLKRLVDVTVRKGEAQHA